MQNTFQVQFAPHVQHLPERFGSFTIIVLGISILGVVNGIAPHNWTIFSIISAGLGLGIAFSFWWIYFDSVDGSEIKALRENKQIGIYVTWLYVHFPLIIGFTAFGVSIEHVVLSNQSLALSSAEKWLLCDSTFLCLIALGILQMTSIMTNPSSSLAKSRRVIKYNAAIYSLVGAIVVLVLGAILKGRQRVANICHWYHGYSMHRSSHIRCETSSSSSFFKILDTEYIIHLKK